MNEASRTAMRQRALIGIALGIVGIYALLSVLDASSASRRYTKAQEDFAEIQQKLAEIKLLSQAPTIAALNTESSDAITNRIDAALEQAGLPTSATISQSTTKPNRIDNTQYKARKTEIKLAALTLPQIVGFCEALLDSDTGSVVSDLTLNVPKNAGSNTNPEKWEASLTLTQTIYSPKSQ